MKSKHDNFVRIATARTEKVIQLIESFRNFSNASFYDYTPEELEKIFGSIEESLSDTKSYLLDKASRPRRFRL